MRIAPVLVALLGAVPAMAAGPRDWAGTWKGECRLTPAYQGVSSFPASLTVALTDKADVLRWTLIYETSPRDVRNYELIAVDAAAGRYTVDEKNGLFLDAAYSDGVLYVPFTIGELLITATYAVGDDGVMHLNLPSFSSTPSRTTCLSGQPDTCVQSFALSSSQHCWLKRQDMRKLD